MIEYDLLVTVDGEELHFNTLMVDETERVVSWTSYANKTEWAKGCWNEEPAAQKAVYLTCKARKGEQIRWGEAQFRDNIVCRYVDPAGRQIVMKMLLDAEGSPVLDRDGDPRPELRDGQPVLLYADTGDEVRPTEGEGSSPTSDTPTMHGVSTESESGTPLIAVS